VRLSVSRETRGSVSRETLERLEAYQRLLLTWNGKINLISKADEADVWPRHVEDCLQLARYVPTNTPTILDIGSGAGFPGLILAIATNIPTTLVESDARKCAFLQEAARITAAPATILCSRIESASLPQFPVITARALASVRKLLTLTTPHLAPGGTLIFPKGATVDTEIAEAETEWTMTIHRHPSQTHTLGTVLAITEPARAC